MAKKQKLLLDVFHFVVIFLTFSHSSCSTDIKWFRSSMFFTPSVFLFLNLFFRRILILPLESADGNSISSISSTFSVISAKSSFRFFVNSRFYTETYDTSRLRVRLEKIFIRQYKNGENNPDDEIGLRFLRLNFYVQWT